MIRDFDLNQICNDSDLL